MRKLAVLPAAAVAVLAVAPVAAAQSTTYDLTASVSPEKPGSKRKPVPVSLEFGAVAQGTGRPSTSREFEVTFGGIRGNTKALKKQCTVASINARQGDDHCSSRAKLGSGTVLNLVGQSSNPSDTSISCTLNVTIYKSGSDGAAIYLQGGPTVPGASCPIVVSQALDGDFDNSRSGLSLSFGIPQNLMHPLAGLSQGISRISATLARRTVKTKGGRVGVLEAVGGCSGGTRDITLQLTAETGHTSTSRGTARC